MRYTVIALTVSDKLGIAPDRIVVELGDSNLPPAPVAGGSNTTASVCNAVAKACEQIRSRIALRRRLSPTKGPSWARTRRRWSWPMAV